MASYEIHIFMFWIKGAGLENKFFNKICGDFKQERKTKQ